VALARDEVEERLGEGVVLAVGADEAGGVVGGSLRDKVLVLGGLHVLAKVDRAQVERVGVRAVDGLAAREGVVVAAGGGGHLPWQQPGGHAHDRVEVARRHLLRRARERQHRRVLGANVVGEGEALHHALGRVLSAVVVPTLRVLREEQGVAARNVAGARNVAHHQHVLRLGNHGLEVARVVPGKGTAIRVARLAGCGVRARVCVCVCVCVGSNMQSHPSMVLTWVLACKRGKGQSLSSCLGDVWEGLCQV